MVEWVTVRGFRYTAEIRVFITCLHHRDHAALASRDINSYKLKIAHHLCCLFDIAMRFRHSSLPEMSGGSPFSESSTPKSIIILSSLVSGWDENLNFSIQKNVATASIRRIFLHLIFHGLACETCSKWFPWWLFRLFSNHYNCRNPSVCLIFRHTTKQEKGIHLVTGGKNFASILKQHSVLACLLHIEHIKKFPRELRRIFWRQFSESGHAKIIRLLSSSSHWRDDKRIANWPVNNPSRNFRQTLHIHIIHLRYISFLRGSADQW